MFDGRYITVTRKDDGSLRANFKAAAITRGFPVEEYAQGVCHELIYSLTSLVGEEGGSGE